MAYEASEGSLILLWLGDVKSEPNEIGNVMAVDEGGGVDLLVGVIHEVDGNSTAVAFLCEDIVSHFVQSGYVVSTGGASS